MADPEVLRSFCASIGRKLSPNEEAAMSADVESARRKRGLREAANPPLAEIQRSLTAIRRAAERLHRELTSSADETALQAKVRAEVWQRLDTWPEPWRLSQLVADLETLAASAVEHSRRVENFIPPDWGSAADEYVRDLGRVAKTHLGLSSTTSGEGGPLVGFIQAVARANGEPVLTGAAIRSRLYRKASSQAE